MVRVAVGFANYAVRHIEDYTTRRAFKKPRADSALNPWLAIEPPAPLRVVMNINHCLFASIEEGGFGFPWTVDQMKWHRVELAMLCLPIFRDELDQFIPLLMFMFKFEREWFRQVETLFARRRDGKSRQKAGLIAAYMIYKPGATISVYSPGSRQNGFLLRQIWDMLRRVADGRQMIASAVWENKEVMHLLSPAEAKSIQGLSSVDRRRVIRLGGVTGSRRISFIPRSLHASRGGDDEWGLYEEAPFGSPQVFYQVRARSCARVRVCVCACVRV
jgi:hypothetical protein